MIQNSMRSIVSTARSSTRILSRACRVSNLAPCRSAIGSGTAETTSLLHHGTTQRFYSNLGRFSTPMALSHQRSIPLQERVVVAVRTLATMTEGDIKKRLDGFQDLFVEARLCIEDCTDSAGTKYFNEEAEAAQEAVNEAVQAFESLVNDIEDPDEKNRVLRGNGLKVEQLKGELEMALTGGHDH